MIYLDSSALLKTLLDEDESEALEQWLLTEADVPRVSSELSRVEVVRTCRLTDEDALGDARRLLAGMDLIPISREMIERAETVADPLVRSLDAIHLASALSLGDDILFFVVYDVRLRSAAEAEGLPVVAPGAA